MCEEKGVSFPFRRDAMYRVSTTTLTTLNSPLPLKKDEARLVSTLTHTLPRHSSYPKNSRPFFVFKKSTNPITKEMNTPPTIKISIYIIIYVCNSKI